VSDTPKTDREKLEEWADEFSESRYLKGGGRGTTRQAWPGLCGGCVSFACAKDEFGSVVRAHCTDTAFDAGWDNHMRLDPSRPITECTGYWPINSPSVRDLVEQARIITVFKERGGHYI